jgi:hypothetical protein
MSNAFHLDNRLPVYTASDFRHIAAKGGSERSDSWARFVVMMLDKGLVSQDEMLAASKHMWGLKHAEALV